MPRYKVLIRVTAIDTNDTVMTTSRSVQAGTLMDAYKPVYDALLAMRPANANNTLPDTDPCKE